MNRCDRYLNEQVKKWKVQLWHGDCFNYGMKKSSRKIICVMVLSVLIFTFANKGALCGTAETSIDQYVTRKATAGHYLQDGKFDLARAEYKKATELNPKSTASYFNLAIASYAIGDLRGTVSALEKLVELDPTDAEAHYNLGCLKLCLRDLRGSKLAFEKARICCNRNLEFFPLINQGLEFLDEFGKLDPATQDLNLFFLQASLPSQTFVS